MSAVALTIAAIVGGAGALGSLGVGIGQNSAAKKRARAEEAKAKRAEKKLELLEKRRKAPIDTSEQIRGMKDQIFNPYANLGIAMQATNLQLEATDEDLANTLNSINASGTSAGGATALAKMAAQSKAQVAAGLEKQELKNQELRISGEMQVQQQKQALEMQALQEEVRVGGEVDARLMQQGNRQDTLMANSEAQAAQYFSGGQQAMMAGMQGFTEGMGTTVSAAKLAME